MNLDKLLQDIKTLNEKYDVEREKNRFNVFTALYKYNEEVRLHSRFISYLLSPISGHGMNAVFLKIFVREILNISEYEFDLNGCEVIPNEFVKKEEDEIDIFIKNKKRKQAIIIENKIDAKDSNHDKKEDGKKGQLERYFNETKDKGYEESKIYVFFLTKDRDPSGNKSLGILNNKENWRGCLYYGNELREWLQKCIQNVHSENYALKEFISQYLNLVNKMTHNDLSKVEKIELKNITAQNLESVKYIIDNFKHVKWHTIDDFWNELKNQLTKTFTNVRFYTHNDIKFHKAIDLVSHQNKNINYGVFFEIAKNNNLFYISGLNNLSWGIDKKGWFSLETPNVTEINFSDFSSNNTYDLIDNNKMKNAVTIIINEIKEEINKNFENIQKF